MSEYFTKPADLAPATKARSVDINALSTAVDAGFSRLPGTVALATDTANYGVDSGTVNAIAVAVSPYIAALTDGFEVRVKVAFAITITTPTLNVNGLGAVIITRNDGSAIQLADIKPGIYRFAYNTTLARWTCAPPGAQGIPGTAGGAFPYLHVREEQGAAVSGGTSAAGYNDRTLNTVVGTNSIPGASLASSRVTLPAGTYEFVASAPCWSGNCHRLSLYNHTDSADIVMGTNALAYTNTSTDALCRGKFVLVTSKDVKLRHYIVTGVANGLGVFVGTVAEVYASLQLWKVA